MPPAIRRLPLPPAQPPRGAHPTIATHSARPNRQQLATPVSPFCHSYHPFPRFLLQPCRTRRRCIRSILCRVLFFVLLFLSIHTIILLQLKQILMHAVRSVPRFFSIHTCN
ncbi:hypothetical protein PVAP13_2NG029286 [Panicum virgatum]|uniref:Uncharacterized protein n=1 Tax=Panicum virgatum TaxID=38727 RepID=A0A8T0VF17_PANVG|nr:hypothetical protein PVAP13_2NG029286 [Panicum virgatum]